MTSTDPPPADDESGATDDATAADDDEAAGPSRARVAAHGWLPWAAGAAAVLTQLLIFAVAPERWRGSGSILLAAVTLALVAVLLGRDGEGEE